LKAPTIWIAIFAAVILFWDVSMARRQEPQALASGLNTERTHGPADNHIYTITLQEGAAVLGEADQHGVALVVDVFPAAATLRLRLILQKARQDLGRNLEAGSLKAFRGNSKIHQSECGSFPQNTQCPDNYDAALLGLVPPLPVVNNQLIGPELSRKQDCITLPWV
jgi:hypothetical protein